MAPRTFVELAANPSLEQDMSDAELSVIFSGVTIETFDPLYGPRTTVLIRSHHPDSATIYQATVPRAQLGDQDVRVYARLIRYATAEASTLQGEVLGVTGRIDCVRNRYTAPPLQGSWLFRSKHERMPNTATCQRSGTNGSEHLSSFFRARTEEVHDATHEALPKNNELTSSGLGRLGKLPCEIRAEVYKHAFLPSFWQCFRKCSTPTDLALLGIQHSNSQTPELFRTSSAICAECLESVYIGTNKPTIVIGSNVIACNFPVQAGMVADQVVDGNKSQVPSAEELFIGIQAPSPRSIAAMAAVRLQVERVTHLINAISANHRVPPIRVSFETKNSRSFCLRSNFEILMAPLYKLRLPPVDENLKYRLPLLIERLMYPMESDTKRIETCNLIESAIEHPDRDHSRLIYRQLMIDVKLSLAICPNRVLRAPFRTWEVTPLSDTAVRRLAQDVKDLVAWYKSKRIQPPDWLNVLHQTLAGETIDLYQVEQLAKQVVGDRTMQSVGGVGSSPVVCTWASGHTSAFNPFFREGEEQYWE